VLHTLPGHLLWRAQARVSAALGRILPPGTDIWAHAVLLALADHEPQSQRRLAELVAVSGTTMTAVAQGLVDDGLVERVRNPQDRRSYALTRTRDGRSAVRRSGPHVARLEEHLTASLTPAQVTWLQAALRQVIGEQLDAETPAALLASTWFLLVRAHHAAHRDFQAALRPLGIEPRDFGTMRAIGATGPVPQHELAQLLDVSGATVVQIVDGLEAAGLVVRRPDPADRRVHRVELTASATDVLARAEEQARHSTDALAGGPGSPHLAALLELLPVLLQAPPPASSTPISPHPDQHVRLAGRSRRS